jgi:hypothetical protein
MKHRLLAIGSLILALGLPLGSASAMAETLTPVDVKKIQEVVKSHLEALAEDDAAQAFESATSATRVELGSPENFLQLIREEYTPIYRSRHPIFSAPEVIAGDTIQVVRITDETNHVWVALFRMERDADRSWKIDGCELLETTSISI